jgi:MFS family permease
MWGPMIDRRGAKLVYLVSMLCVALVPLPWVWAQGLGMVLFAQVLSGLSWSGYEVGYLAMQLENSTSKTRPYVFAAQSMANGLMQIAGVMAAAHFLLPRVEGYREVFLASTYGRVAITAIAPFALASMRGRGVRSARLAVRLFGLRAHGGFAVRPVLTSDSADDARAEEDDRV